MISYFPKYTDDCEPRAREINRELLERHVPAGGRIVDLGAGKGELCRSLKASGFSPVGIDLNPPQPDDFPGIEAHQANLEEGIPLEDGSCDGAIAQESAHQLENPWQLFREISRVLRPGGVAVVSVPNLDHLFVRAYQLLFKQTPFFLDRHYRHAHQVTPIPKWNIDRMGEQAGLTLEYSTYSINYLPVIRLKIDLPPVSRLGHTLITLWRK